MGCPPRNRLPAFFPNTLSACSVTAVFVLPTSVSKASAGSIGPSRPIKSTIARTGVASITNWLPRTASAGFTNPSSMTPPVFARFSAGSRSQPTIRPLNPLLPQRQRKRPADQPCPDDRDLPNSHRTFHHRDTETQRRKANPGELRRRAEEQHGGICANFRPGFLCASVSLW